MPTIHQVEQGTDEWFELRKGKVTGSKLKGIVVKPTKTYLCAKYLKDGKSVEEVIELAQCTKQTVNKIVKLIEESGFDDVMKEERKLGFYELAAERLGVEDTEGMSSSRERGTALEAEAREMFNEKTGKAVEEVGFITDDKNPNIALSPDGIIKKGKKIVEAVEIKCLSAARHLQAHFEQEVPSDYIEQVMQYFCVLPDLKTLNLVFYDPRITCLPFHVMVIKRSEVEEQITWHREYQEKVLLEIDELIENLTF